MGLVAAKKLLSWPVPQPTSRTCDPGGICSPNNLPNMPLRTFTRKFGIESKHFWQLKEIQPNVTQIDSIETITGATLFLFIPLGVSLVIKYLNNKWVQDLKKTTEHAFQRTNNN